MENKEVWKDIPGYDGKYQASNLGRIRSYIKLKNGNVKKVIISPKKCSNIYKAGYRVDIYDREHKQHTMLIARLVCTTWHEDFINTDLTVNHIDGNRLNNRIENLEWLSRADNIRHGYENHLYDSVQKSVTLKSVDSQKTYSFRSQQEASRFLNRGTSYISRIRHKGKIAISKSGERFAVA